MTLAHARLMVLVCGVLIVALGVDLAAVVAWLHSRWMR
jgi:hypothetical protein